MSTVFLISTGHKERGLCNSNELYKIIEKIAPNVIFEEMSQSGFSAVYDGTRSDSVETKAIKKYLQTNPIAHLPVDLEFDESTLTQLKYRMDRLFDLFDHTSPQYNYYTELHAANAYQNGFPYLNSNECSFLLQNARVLEYEILRHVNSAEFSSTHYDWLTIIGNREREMIKNIYNHIAESNHGTGLLLVGAEHRKPMIDEISKSAEMFTQKIDWIFDFYKKLL